MPYFFWSGINLNGESISGKLFARSIQDLDRYLFNQEIVQAELKARGGDLGVRRVVKYKGAGMSPRKRYKRYGSEIDY